MDKMKDYFCGQDFNCAESVLKFLNDEYHLGLDDDSIKLVSGFGGGLGCGKTCGALCGCIAAFGKLEVKQRAHENPDFKAHCGEFTKLFEEKLGSTDCCVLKPRYFEPEIRCLKLNEAAVALFREFYAGLGK